MARRVNTPDGKFGGIVMAAVTDAYFHKFYKVLKKNEGIETALVIAGKTGSQPSAVFQSLFGEIDGMTQQDIDRLETARVMCGE